MNNTYSHDLVSETNRMNSRGLLYHWNSSTLHQRLYSHSWMSETNILFFESFTDMDISKLVTKRSCRWKKVVNHTNYEWQKDDTCNWIIIWVAKCCMLAIWNFWFWRDEGITTTRHIAACTTTALLQKAKLSFEYTGRDLWDHQQEKYFIKM